MNSPVLKTFLQAGLVAVGGALGALSRDAINNAFPQASDFPWTTMGINIVGASLLGLLISSLDRADPPSRPALQLTLGTGFLGGFTTYSTFVTESVLLAQHGNWLLASSYSVGSIGLGFLAAWLGLTVFRRHTHD